MLGKPGGTKRRKRHLATARGRLVICVGARTAAGEVSQPNAELVRLTIAQRNGALAHGVQNARARSSVGDLEGGRVGRDQR